MDVDGNPVGEDESLAFGCPVTIDIHRRDNVFCMDETGDNTHGKNDCKNGGEKKVVTTGTLPREVVGIKNSHFTAVPITDLNARLVMFVVIFAGELLNPKWCWCRRFCRTR